MSVSSPDFESGAYTNFATPACIKNDKTLSLCRQDATPDYFIFQRCILKIYVIQKNLAIKYFCMLNFVGCIIAI